MQERLRRNSTKCTAVVVHRLYIEYNFKQKSNAIVCTIFLLLFSFYFVNIEHMIENDCRVTAVLSL